MGLDYISLTFFSQMMMVTDQVIFLPVPAPHVEYFDTGILL
jgi:hypothetical protein